LILNALTSQENLAFKIWALKTLGLDVSDDDSLHVYMTAIA